MSLLGSQVFANPTTPCWIPAGSVAYFFAPASGSFSSTITQAVAPTTVVPLVYDTIDIPPVGLTCVTPSANITVANAGRYKVLSTIQCDKTTGGSGFLDMWINVNGTAVPNSATRIEIAQNQELILAVEWFLDLTAGQAISISLYSPGTGMRALAIPAAAPIPAIPSIITTINRIA
jgi:hypothetical protein